MKLRDAKLINYNENTQRTLRRIIKGTEEKYSIAINYKQVHAIEESFESGVYISNTITLNIPSEADFDYIDGRLIINSIEHFDIIDGYHRYLALSNINKKNPNFNIVMELRIVCFSEEKAKQFIWQEDQKTKMKKIDSDLMNRNNNGNQVVTLLNQSGIVAGRVNTTNGIINAAVMARALNETFFRENKLVSRSLYIRVRNHIVDAITYIYDENTKILDDKWNEEYICAFVVACYKCEAIDIIPEYINNLLRINTQQTRGASGKVRCYLKGGE